jgi:hypothetical protein
MPQTFLQPLFPPFLQTHELLHDSKFLLIIAYNLGDDGDNVALIIIISPVKAPKKPRVARDQLNAVSKIS